MFLQFRSWSLTDSRQLESNQSRVAMIWNRTDRVVLKSIMLSLQEFVESVVER